MQLVTLEPFAFVEQNDSCIKWDNEERVEVIIQEDGGSFMLEYIMMRKSVKNDFNNLEVEWI